MPTNLYISNGRLLISNGRTTIFLGARVGYQSGPPNEYMHMPRPGHDYIFHPKIVFIEIDRARADGHWADSVHIQCWAGWYIPHGGSGPCRLTVTYNGRTSHVVTPSIGKQHGTAEGTTLLASILVTSAGDYALHVH